MSSETYGWAKEQKTGDPVTKAVLIEIANWARPTGVCEFLAIKRIAEVTEVSPRTVQRHIARLENPDVTQGGLGLIRRVHRHRDDGGQGANCFELIGYQPPLSVQPNPPRQPVTPPRQIVTPPCQIDGEGGDNGVTRLGDKIITLSSDKSEDRPLGFLEGQEDEQAPLAAGDAGEQDGQDRQEGQQAPVAPVEGGSGVGGSARGARLPHDWTPPAIDTLQPKAREFVGQWPAGAYEAVCEAFRCHWHSETRAAARKCNWDQALSKWLVNDHATIMRAAKAGVVYGRSAGTSAGPAAPPRLLRAKADEDDLSRAIHGALKASMPPEVYDHWLGNAAIIARGEGLQVIVGSAAHRDHCEANLGRSIAAAANRITGGVIGFVRFDVETSNRGDAA